MSSINSIILISTENYELFCAEVARIAPCLSDFSLFKDDEAYHSICSLALSIFSDEIKLIKNLINTPDIAIAAVDVPKSLLLDEQLNTVYGAAVIHGIFSAIGIPNIDLINNLPFAIHTASHSNADTLNSNNLSHYSPEVKLGFHNDGLLSENSVMIPEHIVVYNLHIAYHRPGNFMWIPTTCWSEAKKYEEIAKSINSQVRVNLTPSYYKNDVGDLHNSINEYVDVPAYSPKSNSNCKFFLNGSVSSENNDQTLVDFIQSIRNSLSNNPEIILLPQKERRAFFIKNTMGFHARDIFQEPVDGLDLTRVFLRFVDQNAELYSEY